jgi:hypothetical protein
MALEYLKSKLCDREGGYFILYIILCIYINIVSRRELGDVPLKHVAIFRERNFMDDLTKVGHPDRDTIAMGELYEVIQVAERHHISTNMVYAVHTYLNTKSRTQIDYYIHYQKAVAKPGNVNQLSAFAHMPPTGLLGNNVVPSLRNIGTGLLGSPLTASLSKRPPSFVKKFDGSLAEDVGDFGPGMISSDRYGLSARVR